MHRMINLFCLLVMVFLTSCAQNQPKRNIAAQVVTHSEERPLIPIGSTYNPLELLPEGSEHALDTNKLHIIGICQREDFEKLIRLVGRIRLSSYNLLGLEVVWDSYPLAARLLVENTIIYCIKNEEGEWIVRGTSHLAANGN